MDQQNKTVSVKSMKPIDEVRKNINLMEPQFQAALPPHITPQRFVRTVMTAIQNTPKVLEAERSSLYNACMKAAQDGLLPDGKEAALVPFGNQVQYMPMVGGILKKVRNSGELSTIIVNLVYEGDEFDYWVDQNGEHLIHRPFYSKERTSIIHVYAMAITKDKACYIEIMTYDEIEQVRQSSRAKNSGPWTQWWGEMAKKTVIRRLSKRLPMSTDLEQTIHEDDEIFEGKEPALQEEQIKEEPSQPSPKKSTRLNAIIEAQAKEPGDEQEETKEQGRESIDGKGTPI